MDILLFGVYADEKCSGRPNATEYPRLCEAVPSPLFLSDDLSGDVVLCCDGLALNEIDWSAVVEVIFPTPLQLIREMTASVVSFVPLNGECVAKSPIDEDFAGVEVYVALLSTMFKNCCVLLPRDFDDEDCTIGE